MITSEYSRKVEGYFCGARTRFIDDLPANPSARLLEIGCGNGDTAAYAKKSGKCGWCVGIELRHEAAVAAASQMDQVVIGDIEQIELPFPPAHFNVLLMSEVLEHLRDPWLALRRLRPHLAPGAWVLAGSPNVAHHSVLLMLLCGRWDYAELGIMDRTHMCWFTPTSYRELFEVCGYRVESVEPALPLRVKARCFNSLTGGRFQHLLHTQIYLRARCD